MPQLISLKMKYLVAFFFMLSSCAHMPQPSTSKLEWDLDFAISNLEKTHPNLYARANREEIHSLVAALKQNRISDRDQLLVALMKLFGQIGDSHTNVAFTEDLNLKPAEVRITR